MAGSNYKISVAVGNGAGVTSVASRSRVAVGKLEDNIGNLDRGEDNIIATGETLVYNAESEKWEAVSLQSKVDAALSTSDAVAVAVDEALGAGANLDGGTF